MTTSTTAPASSPRRRRWVRWLMVLAVLAILGGFATWYNFFRTKPGETFADGRRHFLYASIGTEGIEGIPYWIYKVMPTIFPEYLPGPGGLASLGMSFEQGRDLPMGVTTKFIGFERVGLNCAFCHVSHVRLTADQPAPMLFPTGPSHQFRVQDYQSFLFQSASDPRFNADVIMKEIDRITDLSAREKLLYRYVLVPFTRRAFLQQKEEFAWQYTHGRPLQGPGRVDPFNPVRFRIFKEPDDGSVGNADIPSIWNQKERVGKSIHWDGLSKRFDEVSISSAIGDGARNKFLDGDSLDKVRAWVSAQDPPKYPLPINQALVAQGEPLYRQHCADCHALGGERTGTVVPVKEVGTDPHREASWTQSQVDGWKKMATMYQDRWGAQWNFDTFSKTNGYVTGLLDGIWLRGPYLHNGSVPTLRALMDAPEMRPKQFYRGYDVLDPVGVGFISNVPAARGQKYFLYDTSSKGNGNMGHVYGTQLTPAEKDAIVEYMKTL